MALLFTIPVFDLIRIHNSGAAFGMFSGMSLVLTVVACTSAIVMVAYVFLMPRYYPAFSQQTL